MALPIRRPGKKGGFLHNVPGVIQGITFVAGKSGEGEYGPWTAYSARVLVQADGASPVEQFMNAGFLNGDNAVSDDGRSIVGDDEYSLDGNSQFGKFIVSLVEGEGTRFPEERLGDLRNYDAVSGTRVVFERQDDEKETERRGKRTYKGRDGKVREANRDVLLVKEVLALPEVKAGKGTTKVAAKAKPAAAKAVDTDAIDAALTAILAAAPNQTLSRTKMSSSFIGYAVKANIADPARTDIRKALMSDEYIADAAARDLIVLEGEGKSANLILAA